jgi:predicted transcriptional regulator
VSEPLDKSRLVEMTAEVVSAYLSHNQIPLADVPQLIKVVGAQIATLGSEQADSEEGKPKPAVPIRRSVRGDYIVCLEDGKKLKLLKRYLKTRFDMSPQDYREKWGLPASYPMVAPNYAKARSELAQRIGLGRPKRPVRRRAKRAAAAT